ncbi:hypothetical protein BT69DRAFT_1237049 [Atractiella rhizophila]|nr:hypothetical protein BT69DRAFT_1237049 [Atractiella rhizophila]
MKLLAVPLTKPSNIHLIYYLCVPNLSSTVSTSASQQPFYQRQFQRTTNFVATQWTALGKAQTGTWKHKTYMTGERFMQRIEFEEWALKAIDPALAPKIWKRRPKEGEAVEGPEVPLLFPPSLMDGGEIVKGLKAQVEARRPFHKRKMWICLALTPLTVPVGILPLVPNLPFVYLAWRAWSHWRAMKASDYLSSVINKHQLLPTPSRTLDDILLTPSPSPSSPTSPPSPPPTPSTSAPPSPESFASAYPAKPQFLLDRTKIKLLVKSFNLNEGEISNLNRAMDQAEARLADKEETEKQKEKQGSVTEKQPSESEKEKAAVGEKR